MNKPATTYTQAVDWVFGLINFERRDGSRRDFRLDRTRALLEYIGNPHESIPVVHVAGTKGKGSTSCMLAAMLTSAGYRTGLFTSPHISRFEERIQVDGTEPSADEFLHAVQQLQAAVQAANVGSPSYFEAAMLLAWLHFRARQVDIAVLEVGLGGRLDATNVCRPVACIITSISLDHTNVLGGTTELIAREKCGIIKPGVPVISGVRDESAAVVVQEVTAATPAPLLRLDVDIRATYFGPESPGQPRTVSVVTPWETHAQLESPLAGRHQADNLALAVGCADLLTHTDPQFRVPPDAIREGLRNVRWPARMEIVSETPLIVIDTAHNEASIAALCQAMSELSADRPRVAVFGTTQGKDVEGMLSHILSAFDIVILTQYLTNPRAVPMEDLDLLAGSIGGTRSRVVLTQSPAEALAAARAAVGQGLICVTGSFFLAAEVRPMLLTADEAE